jgi:hypothetical protein
MPSTSLQDVFFFLRFKDRSDPMAKVDRTNDLRSHSPDTNSTKSTVRDS